ncbi:conserved virulence factor C family protein [Anaerobacillus isosaccharinicus]|uniref:Virulence factor n=1 Tax=Anaerobacillus isosaccharinicus TaxID=1532552 RepID=A0A1S2KX45_9BACI|nr:conserved virulence factor C family protein [Anaerobacillus isosaccharinicus]MBA5586809.1 conserved virulence factor C family protein [Anaerobacillus isosaccharinicus]QOY34976.1 conserved virulence factor C family protein [Anaerobacillus isosaccharinicus]
MRLISIEPTPSPNSMKLNLDTSLPSNHSYNFKKEDKDKAPQYLKILLEIEGVTGVYQVIDFIALERHPKMDWKVILPQVREAFGEKVEAINHEANDSTDTFGELKVFVHMFRGIPIQIKIEDGDGEKRFGLPDRFKEAILRAQSSADNLVKERQWREFGVRYGDTEEVAKEVTEEISAAYDQQRLDELVAAAFQKVEERPMRVQISSEEVAEAFKSDDWKTRYAALDKMVPKQKDIPLLAKALKDENTSIRRLAIVYLGMLEDEAVLPYLYESLKDRSVTVRRTAGDCLSDIGNPKAMSAMVEALKDKNKLVRWRAAMFLYEVGDETALFALKEAEDDPEFEVSLQIKMAIKRIESGEEAAGSVWQQMTNARKVE